MSITSLFCKTLRVIVAHKKIGLHIIMQLLKTNLIIGLSVPHKNFCLQKFYKMTKLKVFENAFKNFVCNEPSTNLLYIDAITMHNKNGS
jgi:hypothetical protein